MIKTPLRYPGGKTKIAKKIVNSINLNYIKEYREPFLGGGSVFLAFLEKYGFKLKYVLNDIYSPLINFWNEAIYNNYKLQKIINSIFNSNEDGKIIFNKMKKLINSDSSFEQAYSFFILNRITFSGTIEAGGYSKYAFKERFTKSSIERLIELSNISDFNINLSKNDYKDIIKKDGRNVLLFLDPPYYSAQKFGLYGKNGRNHKNFNFLELSEILKKTNHLWVMTIDDNEYIKNLFNFAYIENFSINYVMGNNNIKSKKGLELIISNFNFSFLKQLNLFK